jgi:hypothetical protein
MFDQTLGAQAQNAYEAAINDPCPDWRAVAELFLAAIGAEQVKRAVKLKTAAEWQLADYNVDRVKLKYRSPRLAVRFLDGEAVFTHVPSAPGKPLNVGRALRVAISMYRSRKEVQRRAGFREYDRAIPVPEIFQVRCQETDELFDLELCNRATAAERQSSDPRRARRAAWPDWGPGRSARRGGFASTLPAPRHAACDLLTGTGVRPISAREANGIRDRRRHLWHGQ